METFLILVLIGATIVLLVIGMGFLLDGDTRPQRWVPFLQLVLAIIVVGIIAHFVSQNARESTYKKALDNNPYKKEYIYKQVDSTYVIIDSVYIKK